MRKESEAGSTLGLPGRYYVAEVRKAGQRDEVSTKFKPARLHDSQFCLIIKLAEDLLAKASFVQITDKMEAISSNTLQLLGLQDTNCTAAYLENHSVLQY